MMNTENEQTKRSWLHFDALMPPEMAEKAENTGVAKLQLHWLQVLWLAILAGAFIALGSVFYTVVTAGLKPEWPFGIIKLMGGLVFSLG
jgi:formate transporter